MHITINQALVKLAGSKFRGRFRLREDMVEMVSKCGLEGIREFAVQRITSSLAPAHPVNDGHQTPLKGHPVFIAQHATATCCRTCLNHWWRVPIGQDMNELQIQKAVNLIMAWIEMQLNGGIDVLRASMTKEELASIPFWHSDKRFQCPYRRDAGQ